MAKKTTMTKNVAGNVEEQPWTDAFEKRSTERFEAALAPDVARINRQAGKGTPCT
jgi:hypothetical protein